MKALFLTTETNDCDNHVAAWDSVSDEPSVRVTFDHMGLNNGWQLVEAAAVVRPEVIFYIGACKAPGSPHPSVLKQIRDIAPLVHLCSDATDKPWHPVLAGYRTRGCFDLQVSIDGSITAPVDFSTLTPVDPRPFVPVDGPRDIRCGFSGSVGRNNARSEAIYALKWFGGLTVRERLPQHGYEDHVLFMSWCRMLFNLSWTGSGNAHHIKGRVVEAGMSGCALLEHVDSPIGEWFPKGCWLPWRDAKDAAEIIADVSDDEIAAAALNLSVEVRKRFMPNDIYGDILEAAGVHNPFKVQAA